MRVYIPPKLKRSSVWSWLLLLAGISLFFASSFVPKGTSVVQACSLGFLAVGIWILSRYVLVYYYYEIEGENFRIIRVSGKKYAPMCNISMRTGVEVKRVVRGEKNPPAKVRYSYVRNFMPDDKYVYIFDWNGQRAQITFEPNAEFAALMNEKIEELKKEQPKEEQPKTNGWYDK